MSDLTTKLTSIKEKIEATKARTSRLEGERDGLMRRLEDEHGCKTLAAAEKKLAKLGAEIEKEAPLLEKAVGELAEAVGV